MSQAEPNSMFPFHHSQRHGVIEMKSQGKRGGKKNKKYINIWGIEARNQKVFLLRVKKKEEERKKESPEK